MKAVLLAVIVTLLAYTLAAPMPTVTAEPILAAHDLDHTAHQLPPSGNPPKPKPGAKGKNGSTLTVATTMSADVAPAVVQISTTHDRHLSAPTFKMQCISDPAVHYLIVDYDGPTVSTSNRNVQRWFDHNYCASDGTLTWTSEILGAFDNSIVTCRAWFVVTHRNDSGWGTWSSGLSYQNGGNNNGACPPAGL